MVKKLDPNATLPSRAHPGDAGLDLCASEDLTLKPGARASVGTGIAIALPAGTAGFIVPRSGLAISHGLSIPNAPGLIDEGYRGEVRVLVVNLDDSDAIEIRRGERIAQLVVQRVEQPEVIEVDDLPSSARGEGGFGSTGR
ncbi:MAG: dUTP diphosphatase [Actinobacteria bacterium]|nr:dUTP diphosphatase [Actinomycetota bacterium]